MVKQLLLSLLIGGSYFSTLVAQTSVELSIQHKFDNSNFATEQPYVDENNRIVLINKLQYHISNIELLHDRGISTVLNDSYILVDGEQETYNLGTIPENIQEFEQINFNLGIDAFANSSTPASYHTGHALADMSAYSTQEQSYIFITIEGMVDTDNNNIPDKAFSLRATGDQLLREVSVQSPSNSENNALKIQVTANVANWLKDIDLEQVGAQENSSFTNEQLCDNTNDKSVFSKFATTNITTLVSPQNHIHIDSRLFNAPTIHYKFYTTELLDMTITNASGSYFIQRFDLEPDGDFYISDNLASGLYIVVFTSPKGIRQCKRFVVRN